MSLLTHVFIALSYLSLAVGLGLGLPQAMSEVAPAVATMLGALIALAGIFVHHVCIRSGREQALREELAQMRRIQGAMQNEINITLAQAQRFEEELAEVKSQASAGPEVVAEMKVLQTMLHQLFARSEVKGKGVATAGAGAGGKAATGTETEASGWTPPPRWVPKKETDVLAAIKEAIAANRIDVYLQPVVRLPQRKVVHYEALSRLRAVDGSLIEPRIYLQPAEEEGLIGAIDNALLFRCVQLLRQAHRKRPELSIFCNVSGNTVADGAFFPQFVEFLEQNVQLAGGLILEFPCDGFLAQTHADPTNFTRLSELGYRFSVDRVSTFDIPARTLARLGVSFLKLDANAVLSRLRQDGGTVDARRLRTALAIAGITLIVDKIEAENDVIELLDLPVEYGQGFHFGEPRLAREVG